MAVSPNRYPGASSVPILDSDDFTSLTDSSFSNRNHETPTLCDVDMIHERHNMVVEILSGHQAFPILLK